MAGGGNRGAGAAGGPASLHPIAHDTTTTLVATSLRRANGMASYIIDPCAYAVRSRCAWAP